MPKQSSAGVKHLGVRIPIEMWQALKDVADRDYLTVTQVVKQIIRDFLAERQGRKESG